MLGVATMACLSLLPLYHRHYDVRLLVLTFPALAMLVDEGGWQGVLTTATTIAVLCTSHPQFLQVHFALQPLKLSKLKTLLVLRTTPLACLFSALVYLVCFATVLKSGAKLPVGRREVALGPD